MKINLRYGEGKISIDIPEDQITGIYEPKKIKGVKNVRAGVEKSLQNPIGTRRLRDIAKQGKKVAIVVDDITRAMPTAEILYPVVDDLTSVGINKKNITVIVAVGLHRPLVDKEHRKILGKLYKDIEIISHDAYKKENLSFLGKTKSGINIYINKKFLEADIKILTGDIEYHQFVGYGGGAKSVFPGLGDRKSIEMSHSKMENAGTGPGIIKGNPVRNEIEEIGKLAKADFLINVVLNKDEEVAGVFCGDVKAAFLKGTKLCDEIYKIQVPKRADVVIASAGGYPRDIDLYQAQKAIESARRVVKKGGKIIVIAECREGDGSKLFRKWVREARKPDDISKKIHKKFIMGGHKAYQIVSAIEWANVYLYSKMESSLVKEAFMYPIREISMINDLIRKDEKIIILPHATLTLAVLKCRGRIYPTK